MAKTFEETIVLEDNTDVEFEFGDFDISIVQIVEEGPSFYDWTGNNWNKSHTIYVPYQSEVLTIVRFKDWEGDKCVNDETFAITHEVQTFLKIKSSFAFASMFNMFDQYNIIIDIDDDIIEDLDEIEEIEE
jgi:hypothetical protein